ncbi:MAG: hypothetical protein Q9180_005094 [Flavoplaca navasiana]
MRIFHIKDDSNHAARSIRFDGFRLPKEALEGLCALQNRGKMLGGSSGINYMRLVFASRVDLDDWEVLSNTGWNYESMAPYYQKFEIFQVARPEQEAAGLNNFINENAHGYGGPINASFSSGYTPIQAAWPETMANLGLAPTSDPRDGISSWDIAAEFPRRLILENPLPADLICTP